MSLKGPLRSSSTPSSAAFFLIKEMDVSVFEEMLITKVDDGDREVLITGAWSTNPNK